MNRIEIINLMNIHSLFNPNACSLNGKDSLKWSWADYFKKRRELEKEGIQVILVDMIGHPVPGSTPISNELFEASHPDGTYFALYCHSGGSSGALQKQLCGMFPQYHIVNIAGGIGLYEPES